MRLWRKAFGALKDQNSILLANLSTKSPLRNSDIEATVIRATSHHDHSLDRRNIDRTSEWLRISPFHLKPFLYAISTRMEKTRNWVVALKGLHLMHNVVNSNIQCINKMGRLPFDLSNFKDGHSPESKSWPFDAFIHAYYAFLDQKSALIFQFTEEKRGNLSMIQELGLLQKLQSLIDLLIQVKPQGRAAFMPLVIDVMNGIIIEIHNNYKRMCRGIGIVFMNTYSAGKVEAKLALTVAKKAAIQGEELAYYFEFCQEIGVLNASGIPFVERFPEEEIQELERMVFGDGLSLLDELDESEEKSTAIVVVEEEVHKGDNKGNDDHNNNLLLFRTIITDDWEKFDEDLVQKNPFESPLVDINHVHGKNQELPDLISF